MSVRAGRIDGVDGLGKPIFIAGFVLGCALVLPAPAAEWQVDKAPIRFTLRPVGSPTHPEAGYIAHLPDGGLLPRPHPRTQVVTESGTPLDSYALFHNRETGLWIVFSTPPRSQSVHVYVTGSERLPLWTPGSGLRPGPLLAADPGTRGLSAAKALSKLGQIGPSVFVQRKAGIPIAPLSIGGDESGRPRPTSFYLHAYLATTDPGRTWIAPFFIEGVHEVRVDGKNLAPKTRTDKWGGSGDWFNLGEGFHRVEMFTASADSGRYDTREFRGHQYLTWRTPNMPADELGGERGAHLPDPGTSMWETRIIEDHEIVKSGQCVLEAAAARDGGPVACFTFKSAQNFWFEGEEQLAVYLFDAVGHGNPDDTQYLWSLEGNSRASGKSITWLVPGLREHRVTLTTVSAKGKSTCSVPFFGYSTIPTSMDNANDRRAFRLAMQTVLAAYPAQPDPTARWSDAYWNNLVRTVEYGKGYPLLRDLLGKRAKTAAKKLSAENVIMMQDILVDVAARVDPAEGLKWIVAFHRSTASAARRTELEIKEAEVFMVYLDQAQKAAKKLSRIARRADEQGYRAKIRMGDLYLNRGELNQATQYYAEVQRHVRHERNTRTPAGQRTIDGWKVGALRDASHSETVAALVNQEEYLLARQALDRWERQFPLSKISEDFVLQEARLYMAITDWKRARWLLEPYCMHVDASSFLPDAAVALMKSMKKMKEPREKMSEVASALKRRLEFHPVARELEGYIDGE